MKKIFSEWLEIAKLTETQTIQCVALMANRLTPQGSEHVPWENIVDSMTFFYQLN